METRITNDFKLKVLIVIAIMMVAVGVSEGFSQTTSIYRIHSLFLYNFTKHVKWENADGNFTVGIYGNHEAFTEIRAILESKKVWGKKLHVIEINTPLDLSNCQIAFIPKSNKKKILDFIDNSNFSDTLLVTEDDMINDGAAISFVYEQSKMKFKISKAKIEEVGLKVSSSLVSIGIAV